MAQLFTRKDDGLRAGTFDSIAWLFDVVLKQPDDKRYRSALVFGDEHFPDKIEFYRKAMPLVCDPPAKVWTPDSDTELSVSQTNELIDLLWDSMKKDPKYPDRVITGWGTKTKTGLIACILRIVKGKTQ